jgi:hypothetical protein
MNEIDNELIVERLSLRTMGKYINAIISGEKKVETRMVSPFYTSRLLHYIDKRKVKWDAVKQVKVLHLYAGNKPGSKFVDVKVKETWIIEYQKEIPEGFQKGDMVFEFELGDIIEHN